MLNDLHGLGLQHRGGGGILSPAVWVKLLGNAQPIFPHDHPAIISKTASFPFPWLMSVTDKSARAVSAH